MFLVPRDAAGVQVDRLCDAVRAARAADVAFENVSVGADALVGRQGEALPAISRAVDQAIAALCAEAVGIMGALNEATLELPQVARKQFEVAIGTFQALKHKMADMLIAAEQSRSMATIAAVHADSADRHRAAAAPWRRPRPYIGQAEPSGLASRPVQMHGGMGVVDELVVSHYFKRLTLIDLTFGDADFNWDALAIPC